MKPSIFKNEHLARLGPWHVILFEGLWCLADRKGRLENRPDRIEAEIFPFKFQKVNVGKMLIDLATWCPGQDKPFIIIYKVRSQSFIQVVSFDDHQFPHHREKESVIPGPSKAQGLTRESPKRAHLNPDVLNPESPILNPDITPSALERRSAAQPFWREMIEHLNSTWSAKKRGAKYLWSGKDFASIKRVLKVYTPWDVMALWDAYLGSQDEFAIKQGYSVPEFVRQLPRLVDDLGWKASARAYEDKLQPQERSVTSLVAGLGKEFPR